MNWFDSSSFTSFAKNALKEAQRTIDKALDIKEGNNGDEENVKHHVGHLVEKESSSNVASSSHTEEVLIEHEDLSDGSVPFYGAQNIVFGGTTASTVTGLEWSSSVMILSGQDEQNEGTLQSEIDTRELADDQIDPDGFAQSRLEVTSTGSDSSCGFARQESQGSLISGRSLDFDVPVAISEDVFEVHENASESSIQENTSIGSTKDYVSDYAQNIPAHETLREWSMDSLDSHTITKQPSKKITISESEGVLETSSRLPSTPEVIVMAPRSVVSIEDCIVSGNEQPSLDTAAPTASAEDKLISRGDASLSSEEASESLSVSGASTSVSSAVSVHPLDHSVESGGSSDTVIGSCESLHSGISVNFEALESVKDKSVTIAGTIPPSSTTDNAPPCQVPSNQSITVEGLLEEAMGEEGKISEKVEEHTQVESPEKGHITTDEREASPSSDRSEIVKVGSDQTSSHSSGDEIETTTSSDIEIISSPSLDGNNTVHLSLPGSACLSPGSRIGPLAHCGSKSFVSDSLCSPGSDNSSLRKKHRKKYDSDTLPSSLTTSFTSVSETDCDIAPLASFRTVGGDPPPLSQALLSELSFVEKGHRRNQSNISETSESSSENNEVERLLKKLSHLSELIEVKEMKIMELSHVNTALQETNLRLKHHVEDLESKSGIGADSVESLREEYTQRLMTMERKFQQALREKESANKAIEDLKMEMSTRVSQAEFTKCLDERDVIIGELRQEGEKLSKQQLTYSNTVKKLRIKEKENATTMSSQKTKLEEQEHELERLQKQLTAKEEIERKQIDKISQLHSANQQYESRMKEVYASNSELEGKMDALKAALESAYRELAASQHELEVQRSDSREQALSAEVGARQELQLELNLVQAQSARDTEALVAQINELQSAMKQSENQAVKKEQQLKSAIESLQHKLLAAEEHSEELSKEIESATRPLLKQMEHLQMAHAAQQSAWENFESSLTTRLNEAQASLLAKEEKEMNLKEDYNSAVNEAAVLRSQVSKLQVENSKSVAQIDALSSKIENLLDDKTKVSNQLNALKTSFAEEISEIRRERDMFEQQLDMERAAMVAEKKKSALMQEQMREKEKNGNSPGRPVPPATDSPNNTTPHSSPTPSIMRLSLSESYAGSQWGDDVFENSSWVGGNRTSSIYDALRNNSTITMDVLTSQLKQKEGEINYLQTEINRYEAQQHSLSKELVKLSLQVEDLKAREAQQDEIVKENKEIKEKYNALLQMYGEKLEEVEELQLDLSDVKEMYKAQIDQLMWK